MEQIVKYVKEWSEAFGLPVNTEFTELTVEREKLVNKIIKSELNELVDARTINELKDGCGDVLWTIIRGFMEYGVKFNDTYSLSKIKFSPLVESQDSIYKSLHTLLNEANSEYDIGVLFDNMIYHSIELFKPFGYDIDSIMESVYISNMSKICKTEDEAKETVVAYKTGKHPDKKGKIIATYYKQVGKYFVVYRNDHKVMKSVNFIEPKFN